MRVTGGKYCGRTVLCPKGIIRPAMDRMRTSLFATLGPLNGLRFLDLFSGSGLVGIEAASRGATPVDFVEKDPKKKIILLRNTSFVDEEVRLSIISVQRFLKASHKPWDIIYVDPPFALPNKQSIIETIHVRGLLETQGRLLLHYPKTEKYPNQIGDFTAYDQRQYGQSRVIFYTRQ